MQSEVYGIPSPQRPEGTFFDKLKRAALGGGSDCQKPCPAEGFGGKKSLAEFALASAKKVKIIFYGGVYVGENTARLANVRRACPSCDAASRSPFKREPSETGLV